MKKIAIVLLTIGAMMLWGSLAVSAQRLYGSMSSNLPYSSASPPALAQDNLETSSFQADSSQITDTPYLLADLGKPYVLSEITLNMENTGALQNMELSYSQDGTEWTVLKNGQFTVLETFDHLNVTAKVVRLSFLEPNAVAKVRELSVQTEFLTEVGKRAKTAASSSYEMKSETWAVEHLTDGTLTYGFSTNPYEKNQNPNKGYYFTVDLGKPTAIGQIVLYPCLAQQETFPASLEVLVSSDNQSFSSAATTQDVNTVSSEKGYGINLGGAVGRYVRVKNVKMRTATADEYLMQFGEIRLFRADTANEGTIRLADENITLNEGKTYMLVPHDAYGSQEVTYTYAAQDSEIAAVDGTGLVRAIAPGTANVYITDSVHGTRKTVTVTVKAREFDFMACYPPLPPYNTQTQYAYMKEAGFTSALMGTWDWVSKDFMLDSLRAANANGIKFYVADTRANEFPDMAEAEVRAYVNEYQSLPNVAGYYLKDEPYPTANPYAATYKAMVDEDPNAVPHMNHLPKDSAGLDSDTAYAGYVDDWVAVLGTAYKQKISFDHYPFDRDNVNEGGCLYHFDLFWRLARKHDIDFEYSVQSVDLQNGFYSNENSVRYHQALGMAYGVKSFRYFTYFTPSSEAGEPFVADSAIMTATGAKGKLFSVVKDINARAKKIQKYLAPSEAVAVYHSGNTAVGAPPVPQHFFFRVTNGKNAIISHFRNEATGAEYVLVVNKDFAEASGTYNFKVDGAPMVFDVTEGAPQAIELTDGSFTQEIGGGYYKLYAFDGGFSYREPTERKENLAAGKPVYVSSSVGQDGLYAMNITDETDGTYWKPESGDGDPYVLVDLKQDETVGAVRIKSASSVSGITIRVSRDNVFYDTVAENVTATQDGTFVTWDSRAVRYIKIQLPSANVRLDEVQAYETIPRRLRYVPAYIQNGNISLTVDSGDFTGITGICALYENGRLADIRTLTNDELTQGTVTPLFTVQDAAHSVIKTFLWDQTLAQMEPCGDSVDCTDGGVCTDSYTGISSHALDAAFDNFEVDAAE